MALKRQASIDGDEIVVQRPSKVRKPDQTRRTDSAQTEPQNEVQSTSRRTQIAPTTQRAIPFKQRAIQRKKQASTSGEDSIGMQKESGKQRSLKRSRDTDSEVTTPKQKRHRHDLPPSPTETPSRSAAKLFDRLQLHASATPQKNTAHGYGYQTPPTTPQALEQEYLDMLPKELLELVAMYGAIASAISAQLASNVSSTRIEAGELLAVATSTWSKRRIVLDDLLKVLPLAKDAGLAFDLEDFGRAGVFLVQSDAFSEQTRILDTTKLRKDFERTLRIRWLEASQSKGSADLGSLAFVEDLPRYAIATNDVVQKAEPLFSRGKQRLADLKSSQAVASQSRQSSAVADMSRRNETSVQDRGSSLLDRILAKQAITASMPAGPTKEQLERKSALYRVEEVTRVLDLLSAGRARASFSMLSVTQQLQQSIRSPMSRSEIQLCLELMAAEVMPSFLSVIKSGTVSGIVITRNGKLGIADLKMRLAEAGM